VLQVEVSAGWLVTCTHKNLPAHALDGVLQ
jgi:hypothetical protein